MFRSLLLLLFLTTPSAPAQNANPPKHHNAQPATEDDKWLHQVQALQNRARHILRAELSRKSGPACDLSNLFTKFSNAEHTHCTEVDEVITEHNYQAFVDALSASLSTLSPDEDPYIHPLPSKNLAAAEAAWRTYLDRACAALGDFHAGGSSAGASVAQCQQYLTRQHMQDLNEIFLMNRF